MFLTEVLEVGKLVNSWLPGISANPTDRGGKQAGWEVIKKPAGERYGLSQKVQVNEETQPLRGCGVGRGSEGTAFRVWARDVLLSGVCPSHRNTCAVWKN